MLLFALLATKPTIAAASPGVEQTTATAPIVASHALPTDCTTPRELPGPKSPPAYPPEAKALGQQGSTDFAFVLSADGSVEPSGLAVIQSSGSPLLDEAATKFMRAYRFRPGTCNGAPVRMRHRYRVSFRLASGYPVCAAVTDLSDVPQQPPYPEAAMARGERGSVRLVFEVNVDGLVVPKGLTIAESSNSRILDAAAVVFMLGHRFRAANCGGVPMSQWHSYRVNFGLPDAKR